MSVQSGKRIAAKPDAKAGFVVNSSWRAVIVPRYIPLAPVPINNEVEMHDIQAQRMCSHVWVVYDVLYMCCCHVWRFSKGFRDHMGCCLCLLQIKPQQPNIYA